MVNFTPHFYLFCPVLWAVLASVYGCTGLTCGLFRPLASVYGCTGLT
jgi:hypothetical protein